MLGKNDGVKNEKDIVKALDGKKYNELNEKQKKFIMKLNSNVTGEMCVKATQIGGQGYKPDIKIKVGNLNWNISVKKGGGNSVHQEKTDAFLHYCSTFLGMTESEKESLLLFLYGDGTIDGDSAPEDRLTLEDVKIIYEKEIKKVQSFLDRNKRNLIERFLIYGRFGKQNNVKADYLYHGDSDNGIWCPLNDEAVDYLCNLPNSIESPLSIGALTLQVWNRNTEGKPNLEDRRHSIQIKWGSCKSHIENINKICISKIGKKTEDKKRILGDNSQGFENQDKLLLLFDNQRVGKLVPVVKDIISEMYPYAASSDLVQAKKVKGQGLKPRISIEITGEKKNLSIFMGNGNSVHQEDKKVFLPFCRKKLNMTDEEEEAFLKILYADGTIDGTGKIEDRLYENSEIRKTYASEIKIVQSFLDKNRKTLIERFLIYGKNGLEKNVKSDYVYYGTDSVGRCLPYPEIVKYIINEKNSSTAVLSIGSLTIQTWNRNGTLNPNFEYKRDSIQVKWGSMKSHFNIIRAEIDTNKHGKLDGDWEEYELVGKLNRSKRVNGKLWSKITDKLNIENLDDIYAVKVSTTTYSKLAERNVLPKADAYLVKGKLDHQVLIDNNYWLDEDIIENLQLEIINGSGISCKRPDSRSFTYAKMSQKSFIGLFGSKILGAGISIFIKQSELELNENVVEAWNTNEKEIIGKWKVKLQENGIVESDMNIKNIEVCKIIKNESILEAKKIIKSNRNIAEAIFMGNGIFKEPYVATFTYINNEISIAHIPEFSITTGSGRHKGRYTIVIKP